MGEPDKKILSNVFHIQKNVFVIQGINIYARRNIGIVLSYALCVDLDESKGHAMFEHEELNDLRKKWIDIVG